MNFKPTIIATDKEHLQDIILQEILDHGYNCDLNHIDVSGITDMSSLLNARRDFRGQNINLLKFNGFIDQWNVANVVNMERMFHKTQFNGDISNWDVSRVTNMRLLFADSPFNGDISAWNTSRVEDMCSTFAVSVFKGDISQWGVSRVQNMNSMFSESCFNGDLSRWDVANVKEMSYMFYASEFDGDISAWNTSKVENMGWMFSNSTFNGAVSKWNVSACGRFIGMFEDSPFHGDVSGWAVRLNAQVENFWTCTPEKVFKEVNVYHWYLALKDQDFFSQLPSKVQEHFNAYGPFMRTMASSDDEAAIMLHNGWIKNMHPSLSIEALNLGIDFNDANI